MDFEFSEEELKFRQEVRDFFDRELPPDWTAVDFLPEEGLESEEDWAFGLSLRRKMAEKGWLSLWWPKKYGGQGRSRVDYTILREEIVYRGAPGFESFGAMLLAPGLLAHGTEEQKGKYLPPIARGEVQWCQGFSEPNAGSDLASITTRAIEEGDYFIVDGQKSWTSLGYRADWGFFLVRTDPTAARHRGLSFLLMDMKTPGITLKPVYSLFGHYHWNEIFLDGVRVPKENLIGEKNQGWNVATTILNYERLGIEGCAISKCALDRLVEYVKEKETLAKNAMIRHKLAALAIELEVSRLLCYRTAWMQDRGLNPVHQASMGRSFGNDVMQHIADAGLPILGLYGQLEKGSKWAPMGGVIERTFLSLPPWIIAGGSQEIQKNIVAIMGLGLPR
jgi:hypothetical protein